ncbi:hypothetical protein ACFQ51_02185 [Streptomyces kaempferi]
MTHDVAEAVPPGAAPAVRASASPSRTPSPSPSGPASPSPFGPSSTGRRLGLARCPVVLGMFAVHIGPDTDPSVDGRKPPDAARPPDGTRGRRRTHTIRHPSRAS